MKSTGIVRKLDELGRIVLPVELRRIMDLSIRDQVEISMEDDRIVLRKYHPSCIFCGEAHNVINFRGKLLCPACIDALKKI